MDDIEALCPACVEGDHNDCEGDYCMCIDMEHDGGQFGEDGSTNQRLEQHT